MAYAGKYNTPTDLLHDEDLSHDEKVNLLEKWRNDAKDLVRASGEGMQSDDSADILKQVKKALISLQQS